MGCGASTEEHGARRVAIETGGYEGKKKVEQPKPGKIEVLSSSLADGEGQSGADVQAVAP